MTALSMTRGDRAAFAIALTEDDVALDLTDLTVTFTAKYRITDADDDAVIVATVGAGLELVGTAEDGTLTLTVESAQTVDITRDRPLVWDIQTDDGAGDVRTRLTGTLAITRDVTRTSGA